MTQSNEPYGTARGVEAAIKDAAKRAAAADPALDTNKRIQLEYFNRFLSRIFSEGADSEWVLKGGAGMLARIPSTRSTKDIDLYRQGFTLDQALVDLRRLAAIDLGDHFRFEYASHETTIGADAQPYTDGYRVTFNIFIGVTAKGSLHIDLAVGAGMTDQVTTATPATALELPRLISNPYRLYPVVDQIAGKVCATMTDYEGRVSSREKDLVDLIVFAVTQDIDGDALAVALDTERRRRQMEPFTAFSVPSTWGSGYVKLSKSVPHCSDYRAVGTAAELASQLLDPVLMRQAGGKIWAHKERRWV
ncbi:nucleotidyl transferase AbiEii/AbiGii toxin family protein [Propionimicrobium sp. PCR01-08-3]|uniref:nucleotidyl transferase AbiEii/AbiGii toxin family protein n=1 Tax=Propionimicrobium sp. PCR01-08-3 TaxID=3052086 RepID=UPI00255C92E4|nr:nucleotidyl transferase AbiEii/AbiGii toxin family protein [Propionimicrobium sp. PCR01-08-3]WIY84157.1 nucleotidyl transferase AbiEii/AbiGii toxin family protein [Propionimicrobium sp. PCR01-08-3]